MIFSKWVRILVTVVFFLLYFMLAKTEFLSAQENTPHKKLNFDCGICHATTEWSFVQFDHNRTHFRLEGVHQKIRCTSCHDIADFGNSKANCAFCHVDIHRGKLNPNCSGCHTTARWTDVNIYRVHANTTFPILGAHAKLDCDACHVSEVEGRFAGIRSNCFSCHQKEFLQTQNPVHTEFGFGVHCEQCHTLFQWTPATFANHDERFPISSGRHAGEWKTCRDCHTSANDYKIFSCLNCHEHAKDKMDSKHRERRDYVYESSACYRCHPRGNAEDGD